MRASAALAWASLTLFTTSASAQSQTTTTVQTTSAAAPQPNPERYRDGIIIWETPDGAKLPFLLKFNINTQLRYLNTQNSEETFTDHLGVTRDVNNRNDITVNRAMFILGGYIFDQRARYSFTVWTSAGAASIVIASNIGWVFNKAVTIMAGYTGVPGSRSLVNTFPFYTSTDRTMADNFFRPGFTQGVLGQRRTRERVELSGVRRQRSQYPEYLGQQDRHASGVFRQRLVGTDGSLRGTRQVTQHVRRLLRHQEGSHANRYVVHQIPGGSVFKSRSIKSREHVSLQLRRRADLLDRSVCARCHGQRGDVQDVGDRRRPQMERAGGQRAVLLALAERFRRRRPASRRRPQSITARSSRRGFSSSRRR